MSAVIKPAHRAVLSYNTVFNIIHTAVGLLYLIVNFPFHACQILRMYHTAEWIMHLLPELLYRFTAKQTDCTRIGIEQFFFAHCAIDKKAFWHICQCFWQIYRTFILPSLHQRINTADYNDCILWCTVTVPFAHRYRCQAPFLIVFFI